MMTKPRGGSWMVTLPVAAGTLAYLVLVFLPAKREIDGLRAEIERKERFVAQRAAIMPVMHATQDELRRAEKFTVAWSEKSPDPTSRPRLYREIQELANQANVETFRFNPEAVESREAFCRIPLAITCAGSFEEVFTFLRSVEQLPLAIWIDALKIEKISAIQENVMCEARFAVFADNPGNSD